jgi:RNA polymerase sigma-70 factor, ECF subfamily
MSRQATQTARSEYNPGSSMATQLHCKHIALRPGDLIGSIVSDPHSPTTSWTIIDGVQRKDPESWRKFVQIYGELVRHWSCRAGLNDADAADVTQNVLQTVFRHIDKLRREGSFRGWLRRVTVTRIQDHFRAIRKMPIAEGGTAALLQWQVIADSLSQPVNEGELSDDDLLKQKALEIIHREFDSRTWQAFWHTAVEGKRPHDVAAELGLTVSGVHKARSRILLRLRLELADWISSEPNSDL